MLYYHATKNEYVKNILREGLNSIYACKKDSITDRKGLLNWLDNTKLLNKLYITKDLNLALSIACNFDNPAIICIKLTKDCKKFIKIVDNPELLGMSEDDWVSFKINNYISNNETELRNTYRNLSFPNTLTIEGIILPLFLEELSISF